MEAYELVPNTKVTLDGEPGVILAIDAQLVFLARESGKVDLYQTDYVSENCEEFAAPDQHGNGGDGEPDVAATAETEPEPPAPSSRKRATASDAA